MGVGLAVRRICSALHEGGLMAINKRKDRTGKFAGYQVVMSVRDPRTGKSVRRSMGTFLRRKDADLAEHKAKIAIQNGTFQLYPPEPSQALTVHEAVDVWFETKAQSIQPNSAAGYKSAIGKHVLPAFGHIAVAGLTRDDVQRQVNRWRSEGMGVRLLHRCVMVLRASLARQVANGKISSNPADGVEKPSARTRNEFVVWSDEEAQRFRLIAEEDRLAPFWFLTLQEGMRRGEALGLRWRDLQWSDDGSSCVARISQTIVPDLANGGAALVQDRAKTRGSQRAVLLTPTTTSVLRAHRDRQRFERQTLGQAWSAGDLIVTTTIGTPVTPSSVKRSLNSVIDKAGVPHSTTHGLRHMAATVMLKHGVSPALVALKLGHSAIGTTVDLYGHLAVSDQRAANVALEHAADRGRTAEAGTNS